MQCHLIPNYYPPFHSCRNWGLIRLGKIPNCSQLSNKSRFWTQVCLSLNHIFYSYCSMWPCPLMVCYLNDCPANLTDGSFCTVVTYMMKQTFQMWLGVWTLRWGEHSGLSRWTQCNHMNLTSDENFPEVARETAVKTKQKKKGFKGDASLILKEGKGQKPRNRIAWNIWKKLESAERNIFLLTPCF